MSSSTPVGLLPSHVRALEAAVGSSAVAHEKFEWRMADAAWAGPDARSQLPAMVHVESGSLFSIEYHEPWQDEFGAGGPAEFRYFRSPGVPGGAETIEARAWSEVLFDFRLWLRLIAREISHHDGVDQSSRDPRAARFADLWPLLHPDIRSSARSRFDAGRYADAVQAAFAHVDASAPVSALLPGVSLPVLNAASEMNEATAIHFLFLASLLRRKLGEPGSAAGRTESLTHTD
jgi:hypothetical protein